MKIIFDELSKERRLIIKEYKAYLLGIIADIYGNTHMSAKFYFKDGDATIYRVKEYFNFR